MEGSYPSAPELDITCAGIQKLLGKLNSNKASGPDNIKPKVLKELAPEIAPILTIILNKSLETGEIPNDWRTAIVTPVYKKWDRYKAEYYRPISLDLHLLQTHGVYSHQSYNESCRQKQHTVPSAAWLSQ